MSPITVVRNLFRVAAWLHPHFQAWNKKRTQNRRDADLHLQAGNHGEAEKALRIVLEEYTRSRKPAHRIGGVHLELASVLIPLNRLDEAENHLKQAIACFGRPTTATLEISARIATLRGDHATAQEALKQAIHREEEPAKPDLALLGRLHQELAGSCLASGDLAAADKYQTIALERLEQLHGPDHETVADARWQLGDVYAKQNKFQLAMSCFESSLAIHRTRVGSDSPLVTRDLNSLAQAAMETGDFSRAATEYERTLVLMERQLGTKQTDVAHVLRSLARIYEASGRTAKALETIQNALPLLERAKGPELAEAYELMAKLYIRTGRYNEAIQPLERAQAVWLRDAQRYVEQIAANSEQQRLVQQELESIAAARRASAEQSA